MVQTDRVQVARPEIEPVPHEAKLHVVHVTERLPRPAFSLLLRAIAELEDLGCAQTLIVSRSPDLPPRLAERLPRQVRLIELPQVCGLGFAHARDLLAALRHCAAEPVRLAVHLHAANAGLVTRMLIATMRERAACFYTPHGLPMLNPRRPLARAANRLVEQLAGLLPISPVGRGIAEARRLAETWRRPALVLDTPVDPLYFDVRHCESRPATVASAGRPADQNAPEAFARLALRLEIDEMLTRFVWVGGGEGGQEALLLAAGVHVTGELNARDTAALLAEAAVYVQTSVWEGAALSVMRAMAVGLPCVVTDTPGHRDVIAHGRTGFIVRDLDELERHVRWLLDDAQLRQRLGTAARREARSRFRGDRLRLALLHLYGPASKGGARRVLPMP